MLSFLFPILFLSSCAWLVYVIFKKIPQLAEISQESLTNQETFFQFLQRIFKLFFLALNPKKIRIYFLFNLAGFLNELKIWFLRMYHLIEAMSKKVRQESQKMDWEHHWFSHKDIKNKVEQKTEDMESK